MISHKENEVLKVERVEALCRSQKWAPRADTTGDPARIHWPSALLVEPQACLRGSVPSCKHWCRLRFGEGSRVTHFWPGRCKPRVLENLLLCRYSATPCFPLLFSSCLLLGKQIWHLWGRWKNTRKKAIHIYFVYQDPLWRPPHDPRHRSKLGEPAALYGATLLPGRPTEHRSQPSSSAFASLLGCRK